MSLILGGGQEPSCPPPYSVARDKTLSTFLYPELSYD